MAKRMPVDFKKLFESVGVIGAERDLPVYVDIVYDASAPDELISSVMKAFTSTSANAHVDEAVLDSQVPRIATPADICVIVAGDSPLIGDAAIAARGRGIPSVVIKLENRLQAAAPSVGKATTSVQGQQRALVVAEDGVSEEDVIEIDPQDNTGRPFEELGVWVAKNVQEKLLAFASDFQFLRHPIAAELSIRNSIQNGAIGTVFFMPGADMPLITLNQAKLVLEIATVYGKPLDKGRVKELAVVIASAYGMRGIARMVVRQVPSLLGVPIKAAIAFSGTLAIGYAAIDYFEEGGVVQGAVENASSLYKTAEKYARSSVKVLGKTAKTVRDTAEDLAQRVGAAPAGQHSSAGAA